MGSFKKDRLLLRADLPQLAKRQRPKQRDAPQAPRRKDDLSDFVSWQLPVHEHLTRQQLLCLIRTVERCYCTANVEKKQ